MGPSDCWVTAYVALEQKSLETPGQDDDAEVNNNEKAPA